MPSLNIVVLLFGFIGGIMVTVVMLAVFYKFCAKSISTFSKLTTQEETLRDIEQASNSPLAESEQVVVCKKKASIELTKHQNTSTSTLDELLQANKEVCSTGENSNNLFLKISNAKWKSDETPKTKSLVRQIPVRTASQGSSSMGDALSHMTENLNPTSPRLAKFKFKGTLDSTDDKDFGSSNSTLVPVSPKSSGRRSNFSNDSFEKPQKTESIRSTRSVSTETVINLRNTSNPAIFKEIENKASKAPEDSYATQTLSLNESYAAELRRKSWQVDRYERLRNEDNIDITEEEEENSIEQSPDDMKLVQHGVRKTHRASDVSEATSSISSESQKRSSSTSDDVYEREKVFQRDYSTSSDDYHFYNTNQSRRYNYERASSTSEEIASYLPSSIGQQIWSLRTTFEQEDMDNSSGNISSAQSLNNQSSIRSSQSPVTELESSENSSIQQVYVSEEDRLCKPHNNVHGAYGRHSWTQRKHNFDSLENSFDSCTTEDSLESSEYSNRKSNYDITTAESESDHDSVLKKLQKDSGFKSFSTTRSFDLGNVPENEDLSFDTFNTTKMKNDLPTVRENSSKDNRITALKKRRDFNKTRSIHAQDSFEDDKNFVRTPFNHSRMKCLSSHKRRLYSGRDYSIDETTDAIVREYMRKDNTNAGYKSRIILQSKENSIDETADSS